MLMLINDIFILLISIAGLHFIKYINMPFNTLANLGFIILIALIMGRLFRRFHLPAITGYMVAGLIISPYTFALTTLDNINKFKLIDYFAITFIGMQAGSEMAINIIRKDIKNLIIITLITTAVSFIFTFLFIYFGGNLFFNESILSYIFLLALFIAVFQVANSPVTTIAIINETNIRNSYTYTILGITIIKDIILIILFTIIMAGVDIFLSKSATLHWGLLLPVVFEIFGSILLGWFVAMFITIYSKLIKIDTGLFIMICAFLISLSGDMLHISPLITGISTGFFIKNFSDIHNSFDILLKKLSPFIYILFFPLASAVLNVHIIKNVFLITIIILILRKILLYVSFRISNIITPIEPFTQKYGWMGLINQSGITLALAIIVSNFLVKYNLNELAEYVKTIAIASIIITDFYGPPLFKFIVIKSKNIFKN